MKNAEIVNINLKELNGQTITLGQLIDGIKAITNNNNTELKSKIFVPMYQRNYKWDQEMAVKLVKDLVFAFENKKDKSMSLFTLYIDRNNNIQVVDGQQRMITLLLLYKAIEKEEYFINLEFERDFELNYQTRKEFIDNLNSQSPSNFNIALSDKRRLQYNYLCIRKELNDCKVSNIDFFIEYLKERVKLLLHITEDEPVSEFLNLNCNKTKFSICDRVRSALITYTTFNSVNDEHKELIATAIECTDFKKGISILFEELTRLLYRDDIYGTVNLGYIDPDKSKENRINIMFSKLVNNPNTGYMDCKSLEYVDKIKLLAKLYFYKTVLWELETDFRNGYYVTSNAFKNFYYHKRVLFFDLVDKYFDYHFDNEKTKLSQILHTEHSIDNLIMDYIRSEESGDDIYFVNSYFQVLSSNELNNDKTKYETLLKSEYRQQNHDKSKYFTLDKESFEDIVQGSGKYILYRYIDQHKKENDNNLKFSPIITLEENRKIECDEMEQKDKIPSKINIKDFLCTGNRKIIIPVIQRDYCMGSHFDQTDKVDMLDYIIKNYNDGEKEVTLSAITIFQPNKNDIYIYDGQQRIFTLASLIKLLDDKNSSTDFCELSFEQRENFNKFVEIFFNGMEKDFITDSYAKKSVANLKNALHNKLNGENINQKEFQNYILDKINLDVITVNGALSSAEQFFVEINDGVQLVPYEIFKCKINAKYQELVKGIDDDNINKYKNWISLIDNQWLDFFYRFSETQYNDETSKEELMEMRLIEFCCRMIYWEKYLMNRNGKKHPLKLNGFANSQNAGDIGDCDKFIEHLELKDFERINNIMNMLTNLNLEKVIESDPTPIQLKDIIWNNKNNADIFCIPYYNNEYKIEHRNYYLNKFISSLYIPIKDKDGKEDDEARKKDIALQKERVKDVVMWNILNYLDEVNFNKVTEAIARWNGTIIYDKPFAYITPSFIGAYKFAILPIPSYYYDSTNYINIYEQLTLKKISKEEEFEKYDILINVSNSEEFKGDNTNISIENNIQINYEIHYRYSKNYYCKTNLNGLIFKTNKNQIYVKCSNEYIYFRKRSDINFYRDFYSGYLDSSSSPNKLYINGLVFKDSENQYYININ